MLQFNKSLATNTNALYLETVNTGSGYYDTLRVEYSQSYDQSNGTFEVSATSLPTQYNNWILIQNTGSVVPDSTGQYNVKLYTATAAGQAAVWGTWTPTWQATSETWSGITGSDAYTLVDLLYSDRAWVSGRVV